MSRQMALSAPLYLSPACCDAKRKLMKEVMRERQGRAG